jgi:hypothetical protein
MQKLVSIMHLAKFSLIRHSAVKDGRIQLRKFETTSGPKGVTNEREYRDSKRANLPGFEASSWSCPISAQKAERSPHRATAA